MARFTGKAVIVTGAASGLGAEVARQLSDEGAKVLIVDRDGSGAERVASELPGAIAVQADISSSDEVQRYTDLAVERFGRLDAVHNNAGIAGPLAGLADVSVDELDAIFAVNVRGTFLGVREAHRVMSATGSGGAIVNTASALGLIGAEGAGPYAMSKHAIVGLTRCAAMEFAASNVRVNALCPGYIDTPLMRPTEEVVGDGDIDLGRRVLESGVTFGRYAQPAEVARLATWLLSDESSYVTGATFSADGGMSAGLNLSSGQAPASTTQLVPRPHGAMRLSIRPDAVSLCLNRRY